MRAPHSIYTDTQEHLGRADEKWFKWNFFVLLCAIGLSFGTYLIQQILEFVGMGINTVLFLILVWFLNTWLTSPTLVTGSWLAGLPFFRPFGFTADYLKNVVPFILFWSCGIVLVNSIVPWFWWPFLSYLYMIAIVIGMGIWAWNFKPEGKIVKDLSWKFLVAAIIWALIGLPALNYVSPWIERTFDAEAREEARIEQIISDRQAEIEQAEHDAALQRAVVAAQAPQPVSSDSVVDGCTQRGYEDALNCRTAELGPRMYYESSLDRGDPRARCTFMYPPVRESVVSLTTTGPATNRVTNWSNDIRQVLVYEVYHGETGPDGQEC